MSPKERPILFSGPLVRALLEGRKTVTRRPVKLDAPPYTYAWEHAGGGWVFATAPMDRRFEMGREGKRCPYGKPGDRLWVRETWRADEAWDEWAPRDIQAGEAVDYRACNPLGLFPSGMRPGKTRTSIHMPRWASRITLEVTSVAVERVQDISEDQAKAEGVLPDFVPDFDAEWLPKTPAAAAFANAWQRMYAKRHGLSWHANPWVWAVSFKRVETQP